MSHSYQRKFISMVKNKNSLFFTNTKVLEIGSLNINGTMRDFFSNCDYTGIDIGNGKDVDIVCSGHDYDAPDESYDVTTSGECFEHNPYWAETFSNMIRMTKSGGLIFFTCATIGRPEHGTSRTSPSKSPLTIERGWDYYKNLNEDDFRRSFNKSFDEIFKIYEFHSTVSENPTEFVINLKKENGEFSEDLYFWGIKK